MGWSIFSASSLTEHQELTQQLWLIPHHRVCRRTSEADFDVEGCTNAWPTQHVGRNERSELRRMGLTFNPLCRA